MAEVHSRSTFTSIAVAVVAMASAIGLHVAADKAIPPEIIDNSKQTLPSAESVKLCSLGFDKFLSDMYWLELVQYLGEWRERGKGFVSTYDYVNLITSLDPYFEKAYWFGCWSIGYWQMRPDLAEKIIQRGMSYSPNDWFLPYIAGVNENIFAHDSKKAAAYYRRAAKLPGAPDFLNRQAEILESAVPELVKQWKSLAQLYESTNDKQLKESIKPQMASVLVAMYHEAPTQTIRDSALERLRNLGYDTKDLEREKRR
jgi:hypothetical protein